MKSSFGSCQSAKSSTFGGTLIRLVIMNVSPRSKFSMSFTASTYRCGDALIQIAPKTDTSRLGSVLRNFVIGEPSSSSFRSEDVVWTTVVR